MRIGILGAGVVGRHLALALAPHGYDIMLSSREPQSNRIQDLLGEIGHGAQSGTVVETVSFGDVIAVAMNWQAVPEVISAVDSWDGKVLIDITNRIGANYDGGNGSAAEDLKAMTGAPVLKALNTIGAEHYLDPQFGDQTASMFVCGDAAAKEKALPIVEAMGFDIIDAGELEAAALLENLAALWIHLMINGEGRNFAFKVIRK